MNDLNSLSHTKWNCKYHKYLHKNIIEKYFMERNGMKLEKFCGRWVAEKLEISRDAYRWQISELSQLTDRTCAAGRAC